MTYLLTRASARAAGACYTDSRIAALVPPEGLTIRQVAALARPLEDIVWAITQAMGLPDRILRLSAVDSARRALSHIPNPHPDSVHAVDVAERHALGEATDAELAKARAGAAAAAARAEAAAEDASAWAAWAAAAWAWAAAAWAGAAAADAAEASAEDASAWAAADAADAAAWAAAEADAATEERRAQIATLVRLVTEEGEP